MDKIKVEENKKKWEFKFKSNNVSKPHPIAIGTNGTIYIGKDKKLYAINPDGTKKWEFPLGENTLHVPIIGKDGTIYTYHICRNKLPTSESKIYAISPEGKEKWSLSNKGISLQPIIGDNILYIANDHLLYAINPDGTKKWKFEISPGSSNTLTKGVDGTLYLTTDNNFYAISPDGRKKWKGNVGSNYNPLIGADGTIYITKHKLYAINPDGTKKWEFDLNLPDCYMTKYVSVVKNNENIYVKKYEDNHLYILNLDGTIKCLIELPNNDFKIYSGEIDNIVCIIVKDTIYAINSDGEKKWEIEFDKQTFPFLEIGPDTIYAWPLRQDLFAINPDNGKIQWKFIKEPEDYIVRPIVSKDNVIILSCDRLYAVEKSLL